LADEFKSAMHELPGCAAKAPSAELLSRVSSLASIGRRPLSREQYVEGILAGQRAILARAITLIESSRDPDRLLAEQIIEDCLPHSGNSIRLGITGVPGAGKSSLIETLGMYLIEEEQQKVAVLAIDPSSQISGGSILGDKTRMTQLAASDSAFIRPTPSRGSLGGVARRTREAMLLCEAAGYRRIIVETIGVGQSETAVHGMVDFFLLVLLAGAGDELQGIKRGVMEMADLVLINKADGDNIRASERALHDAQNALHYLPASASGWTPLAQCCSAHTGEGIPELWQAVHEYAALTRSNGWFERSRRSQTISWMHEIIEHSLLHFFEINPEVLSSKPELEDDVLEGRTTSSRAARTLLEIYTGRSAEADGLPSLNPEG
jgi:LAO/AO transport system kinase